jgi:NADPH2:quinone reductase
MKAVVTTRLGGPEVLQYTDVPAPEPRSGEMLINIHAAGLNFADILSTSGKYPGGPPPPFVGGREFAGEVANTGERVMGYAEHGAFAEQIAAPRYRVWTIPEGWSFEQGAAFPVNYFTAYLAYWKASLLPGDQLRPTSRKPRVLIHAVAGGVGTAAVAIGKELGIEMYGTASTDAKLQGAFELGLNHGINYTRQDYEQLILEHTRGEGVDAVFEMIGGEDTAKSIRSLAFNGRCILYGTASGKRPQIDINSMYAKASSVHGLWLSRLAANKEVMTAAWKQLSQWIAEGKLKPVVGRTLPLAQLGEAFQWMSERKNFGKVVLAVNQ